MLLDIRMPGMSGVDVVRQCPKPLPFPIFAMTGHVDADSQEEFRSVWARCSCVCTSLVHVCACICVSVCVQLWPVPSNAEVAGAVRIPVAYPDWSHRVAGFTGCLAKPFTIDGVRAAMSHPIGGPWLSIGAVGYSGSR